MVLNLGMQQETARGVLWIPCAGLCGICTEHSVSLLPPAAYRLDPAQISARPDHWYFGRPELATNPRPVYLADSTRPGADLASEYAAAYAAGAVLFKGVGQTEYAELLYKHAKQAYAFAKAYPKK